MYARTGTVGQIRDTKLLYIRTGTDGLAAATRLLSSDASDAPVIDWQGQPVGVIAITDLMKAINGGSDLKTLTVDELMPKVLPMVDTSTPIRAAIRQIADTHVFTLPVVQDGVLFKTVNQHDLLRALLSGDSGTPRSQGPDGTELPQKPVDRRPPIPVPACAANRLSLSDDQTGAKQARRGSVLSIAPLDGEGGEHDVSDYCVTVSDMSDMGSRSVGVL